MKECVCAGEQATESGMGGGGLGGGGVKTHHISPHMIYSLLQVKETLFVFICLYFYLRFIMTSHACHCCTNVISAVRCPLPGSYKN